MVDDQTDLHLTIRDNLQCTKRLVMSVNFLWFIGIATVISLSGLAAYFSNVMSVLPRDVLNEVRDMRTHFEEKLKTIATQQQLESHIADPHMHLFLKHEFDHHMEKYHGVKPNGNAEE